MARWTATDLKRLCPGARDDYVEALVNGWQAIVSIGLDDNLSRCHFLAQAMHETGDLTIVRENTSWTAKQAKGLWPAHFNGSVAGLANQARFAKCGSDDCAKANLVYGTLVAGLGNRDGDDGWRYRGGGFSQLTGRAAYREYGQRLGIDIEGRPELIEDPSVSLLVYLEIWRRYDLVRFAKHNYGRAIGNQINRGNAYSKHDPIGFHEREACFKRAWKVFGGEDELPDPLTLYLGAYGSEVRAIQERLHELGRPCGAVDGVYGREMSRTIAAFKHDCLVDASHTNDDLDSADCIGQKTRAALAEADPVVRHEREQMTPQGLIAAGSSTAKSASDMQKLGTMLALAGGGGTAMKAVETAPDPSVTPQAVEMLRANLAWVPGLHSFMVPVMDGLSFIFQHFIPIVLLTAGVWFWVVGRKVMMARLRDAMLGLHLGR